MSWHVDEDLRIVMTKGDTPTFAFEILKPDGTPYLFEDGDSVIFAAKRYKTDSDPALVIAADITRKQVCFSEEDTKHLEIGRYIWEMSLNKRNGYRCTFLENKVLKLTVEVA